MQIFFYRKDVNEIGWITNYDEAWFALNITVEQEKTGVTSLAKAASLSCTWANLGSSLTLVQECVIGIRGGGRGWSTLKSFIRKAIMMRMHPDTNIPELKRLFCRFRAVRWVYRNQRAPFSRNRARTALPSLQLLQAVCIAFACLVMLISGSMTLFISRARFHLTQVL